MSSRNPPWSREELILALDLFFTIEPGAISAKNPQVIELSELLNRLTVHSTRPDAERFRNPNGVSMKLANFLRFDQNYQGSGLTRGGRLEADIWAEFEGDRPCLRSAAAAIRQTVA